MKKYMKDAYINEVYKKHRKFFQIINDIFCVAFYRGVNWCRLVNESLI